MKLSVNKSYIKVASWIGAAAVVFGALGAHALKEQLDLNSLNSFNTAVRYQMWHVLALLALGIMAENVKNSIWIFRLWILGIIFFSGSIYLLTLDELMGINLSFLGPITPLGGLALIAGWVALALSSWKATSDS